MVSDGLCKLREESVTMLDDINLNEDAVVLKVQDMQAEGMGSKISFSLSAGDMQMLTGPSGSGKSRLLKAIADLIPHSGQAWLNHQAQDALCPEKWRSQVMYFSAETAWWLESVAEHFEEPPSEETLHSIGLTKGILTRHPDDCSSGEKQRLALLRGLALEPQVLLLDEITANLDFDSTLKVESLLNDYVGSNASTQRALIWITHDVMQAKRLFANKPGIDLQAKDVKPCD